jgi:eukaryotic-like serine/threonine-protein kinase
VHLGRLMEADGTSRTVAVKRLHPQFCKDPEFVAMFIDEARLAARIKHANVVETLDILTMGQELLLVMEYIRGECFSKLLRAARRKNLEPSIGVVGRIASGMLHGLHAAHDAKDDRGEPLNVVHRDISPQNVMIDVDGVVKVLDFGVAKASARIQITRDGQMKGKLSYMSPEQLQGMPVDRRADVFACGVVLWEALTRRRLFVGEDASDVLRKILRDEVPAPSQFVPGLSPEVDQMVSRALSKDPELRYQTAEDLALDIEQIIELAPEREVGAWIDSVAGEILGKRERLLQEIERSGPSEFSFSADSTAAAGHGSITDSDTFQRIQSWAERESARAVADSHASLVVDLDAEGEQAPTVADARCVEILPEPESSAPAQIALDNSVGDVDVEEADSVVTVAEDPYLPPEAVQAEPRPAAFAHLLAGHAARGRARRLYSILAAAAVLMGLATVAVVGSRPASLVRTSGALLPEPAAAKAEHPAARPEEAVVAFKPPAQPVADQLPIGRPVAPVSRVVNEPESLVAQRDVRAPSPARMQADEAEGVEGSAASRVSLALTQAPKEKAREAPKKVARRAVPPRRPKAAPKAVAAAKVDCRQPFWIDEGGIRRLKMACL